MVLYIVRAKNTFGWIRMQELTSKNYRTEYARSDKCGLTLLTANLIHVNCEVCSISGFQFDTFHCCLCQTTMKYNNKGWRQNHLKRKIQKCYEQVFV